MERPRIPGAWDNFLARRGNSRTAAEVTVTKTALKTQPRVHLKRRPSGKPLVLGGIGFRPLSCCHMERAAMAGQVIRHG